jgi:NAD(P)-dependent dehydrogenase (short-subunit alcohol dehydrogenase family)
VAIVTGGTSGIGAAIVQRFAQEGARQVVVALPGEQTQGTNLVASLGFERARFIGGDVSARGTAEQAATLALEAFGRLDVLINNAGIDYSGISVMESGIDDCRRIFDVNFFAAVLMLQASAKAFGSRGGSIVNVISRAAIVGVTGMGVYGASKAALLALTRTAALELAPAVRVNAVAPGATNTGMMRAWIDQQPDPGRFEEQLVSTIPQGRLASPDDVASAVLFLASDESSHVTGTFIAVDGGYTAG